MLIKGFSNIEEGGRDILEIDTLDINIAIRQLDEGVKKIDSGINKFYKGSKRISKSIIDLGRSIF